MCAVPAIKSNPSPINGTASPACGAIEQIRVVQHERIPSRHSALACVEPDDNALVGNPRPWHFNGVREERSIIHFIPLACKGRQGKERGKNKRYAFHNWSAVIVGKQQMVSIATRFLFHRGGTCRSINSRNSSALDRGFQRTQPQFARRKERQRQ